MTRHTPAGIAPDPSRLAPLRAKIDEIVIGRSASMDSLKTLIAMLAPGESSVLIQGPTGTGKEMVAQALHAASGRTGPMISVNCAAIPADLLEAELFGTEKGAYTGADRQRIGMIEMAAGGTLFLDEIGDMPPALQAKMLRVLETRSIQRLGSAQEIPVDYRLVCATHSALDERVREGRFREDLYYRIAVFPVLVPALRERREDIPQLMSHLLALRHQIDPRAGLPHFSESAVMELMAHPWPGNVRELRNVIERAAVLFADRVVGAQDVREHLLVGVKHQPAPVAETTVQLTQQSRVNLRLAVRNLEVALIEAALGREGGNISRAAEDLRLSRTTLIEKLRKYGINAREPAGTMA